MAADPKTMKAADFAKVSEVDFVEQFSENILTFLNDILGITRRIEKVPGQTIKTYKVTGTLEDGAVGEGETIPLSKYKTEVVDVFEIDYKKYRKKTTLEAIAEKGYEQAVTDTDTKMTTDVQRNIRKDFMSFLATGTGVANGAGLQATLANTWGELKDLFQDYDVADADLIYFVNPLDIASYLADKDITVQTSFGFTYVQNFLGLYNVLVHASVPKGMLYATAKNNLILYYMNPTNSDIASAFEFTTDATGLIGVHHETDYKDMTTDTFAVHGMGLYAELIDRVVVATINSKAPESVTLSQKTMSLKIGEKKKLVATVVPEEAGQAIFKSSATDKADVDPVTGEVTGKAAGDTNITAEVGDKVSAACVVTVSGE